MLKHIRTPLLCLAVLCSSPSFAENNAHAEQLQEWISNLVIQLQEQKSIAAPFIQSFGGCLADQGSGNPEEERSLSELFQRALQINEQCTPLLKEMFGEMSAAGEEEQAEQLMRELLEKSL